MRATEAMIAWTPADTAGAFAASSGMVVVVPHPDYGGRAKAYRKTDGACWSAWQDLSTDARLAKIMLIFHTIVVRDHIDPAVAHAAFLQIDEYAEAIDRGIDGAREVEPAFVGITQDLGERNLIVDLKEPPSVERSVLNILDMARPDLGASEAVLALLRRALTEELEAKQPVRLNVQALYWALSAEGLLSIDDVETRWDSIRAALRNA